MKHNLIPTGNIITINEFVGCHRESVPVMRNGKPTKKMKDVIVDTYEDMTATGYLYDGHEIFLNDKDADKESMNFIRTYRADGERLTCMAKFGRYGQADHEVTCDFFKKEKELGCHSNGWQGATWKGAGACIKKINW